MTAPEAKPDDIFGQYLFAPVRKKEGVPDEPNTKKEESLHSALVAHYASSRNDGQLVPLVPAVLKQVKAGNYSKYLGAPRDIEVYRGIRLPTNLIAPLLAKAKSMSVDDYYAETNPDRTKMRKIQTSAVLKPGPSSPIQSWSTSLEVAMAFAGQLSFSKQGSAPGTPVIFIAETSVSTNKFFGNPNLPVMLGMDGGDWKELEVMSIGPVRIKGFYLPGITMENKYTITTSFVFQHQD